MKYTKRRKPKLLQDRRMRLKREYARLLTLYDILSTNEELQQGDASIHNRIVVVKARLGIVRTLMYNC